MRLGKFRIVRYPITVWQFRQFWQDPLGYENEEYWPTHGWEWKQRKPVTKQPYTWDDPAWTADNLPVVGVSWYEAAAFCRWLTKRGRTDGWLQLDEKIRLPSEAEWEVAAMWDTARGEMRGWNPPENEIWQNVEEAGIGRTSPVGIFPQGASPCGALDIAGNMWEWCASQCAKYPVEAHQVYADFAPDQMGPALRGGAYYVQNECSGWGVRSESDPDLQGIGWGFRVVVCSAPPV